MGDGGVGVIVGIGADASDARPVLEQFSAEALKATGANMLPLSFLAPPIDKHHSLGCAHSRP